jgi:hypothetical protein
MGEFNNELLSRLVTWAAGDSLRYDDPEAAQALGLIKDASEPRWQQSSWGEAQRNGVCQTAFCIAGHAVAMDNSLVMVMNVTNQAEVEGETITTYHTDRVVKIDALKDLGLPEWAKTDEKVKGYVWLEKGWSDLDFLQTVFGYDWYYDSPEASTDVETAATDILGIELYEGTQLFRGSNDARDVVGIAYNLAQKRGETLDVPVWVMDHYGSLVDYYANIV